MTEEILTVSWTRLRAFAECKQKAYLRFQGKRNLTADNRIFFPGTVCDSAMRVWLRNPEGNLRDHIEAVAEQHESNIIAGQGGIIKWKTRTDKSEVIDWCIKLSDKLQPILEELVLPYNFDVAYRFTAPINIPYLDGTIREIHITGEMDLRVQEGDFYDIWDLKATENNQYWKKTIGQLVCYDVANMSLTGHTTRRAGLIQPMCNIQVREAEIDENHRSYFMKEVIRYAASVWRKDFTPKEDNAGCTYCDVNHACSKFAPSQGTRKVSLLGRSDAGAGS